MTAQKIPAGHMHARLILPSTEASNFAMTGH